MRPILAAAGVALGALVLAAQPELAAEVRAALLVAAVCAVPVACVLAAISTIGRWL